MIHRVLRGVVHGNTIRLCDDAGVADGDEVEVVLRRVLSTAAKSGEGFRLTEGALAEDSEWDNIMEEVQRSRKHERGQDDRILEEIYQDRRRDARREIPE